MTIRLVLFEMPNIPSTRKSLYNLFDSSPGNMLLIVYYNNGVTHMCQDGSYMVRCHVYGTYDMDIHIQIYVMV